MPVELFFIFGLFAIILGYVIGNFFPMLKDNPFAPASKKTVTDDFLDSLEDIDLTSIPNESMGTPELLEIGQFWRTNDNNQLVVQIDKKLYYQGDDIGGDKQTLLTLLVEDLGSWIGIEGRLKTLGSAEINKDKTDNDEKNAADESRSGFNPINMLLNAVKADVYLPLAELSLADQIDPILQRLLNDSPLENRGISLMNIEGRGMVVNVGLDLYDSVDEVPDEEIKKIIQQAVKKWEQASLDKHNP